MGGFEEGDIESECEEEGNGESESPKEGDFSVVVMPESGGEQGHDGDGE